MNVAIHTPLEGAQTTVSIPPYRASVASVLTAFGSDRERGLTSHESAIRLAALGPNALPVPRSEPAWRRFLNQFRDPLTVLLIVATVVSFVAWLVEHHTNLPCDSIVILAIVILNAALGFAQERRAEQAVPALQAMAAPRSRVIRDGQILEVPSRDIVFGDVLVVEEGDTVPADARVLEAWALQVSEAALSAYNRRWEPHSVRRGATPGIGLLPASGIHDSVQEGMCADEDQQDR